MLKCDPRAFARCPHRKGCSDSPEHTSFYEGTECDYFNQQVIHAPLTNAGRIRAMSDEELAETLYGLQKEVCRFMAIRLKYPVEKLKFEENLPELIDWLKQPADES